MARMGHASAQAALIYQHATADRDRATAEALSDLAAKAAAVIPIDRAGTRSAELGHAGTFRWPPRPGNGP